MGDFWAGRFHYDDPELAGEKLVFLPFSNGLSGHFLLHILLLLFFLHFTPNLLVPSLLKHLAF